MIGSHLGLDYTLLWVDVVAFESVSEVSGAFLLEVLPELCIETQPCTIGRDGGTGKKASPVRSSAS
jgi:hypothetical protein